jgi:protein-tyrosine-phosphatase
MVNKLFLLHENGPLPKNTLEETKGSDDDSDHFEEAPRLDNDEFDLILNMCKRYIEDIVFRERVCELFEGSDLSFPDPFEKVVDELLPKSAKPSENY